MADAPEEPAPPPDGAAPEGAGRAGAEDPSCADAGPGDPEAAPEGAAAAVSLMITRRQKERLRELGFGADAIREMTPAEAHAHLGL